MKTAETIGSELSARVKGAVHVDIYHRVAFSTDASIYRILPECVVEPQDADDIVTVVQYAAANNIPLAPRGAGSGVAGESLAAGIVIDVRSRMNKILQTAPDGSWVRVQPGVVLDTLNAHLANWQRTIGPDPSSGNRAVLGGVVANNATGAHSLQYGYIADYVQSLHAVLADGRRVEFVNDTPPGDSDTAAELAGRCLDLLAGKAQLIADAQPATQRNRCGYTLKNIVHDGVADLARLMVGSEGTLAVFTDITLRTVPIPKHKALVQFEFASFKTMAQAVAVIVDGGASACELMDHTLIDLARQALLKYRDLLPAGCVATLLVEHTGDLPDQVTAKIDRTIHAVGDLATRHLTVVDAARQALLWKSRKDAVPLLNRKKGPTHPIAFIEDISVDYRRLDTYIAALRTIAEKYDFPMALYGHAGDGELHIRPYLDLSKASDVARMRQIADAVFDLAFSLGGSISGEHGDGLLRAAFIRQQYGDDYYQLLKGIKQLFDPAGILNPGKIINDDADIMGKNLRATALRAADGFQTEMNFAPDEFRFEVEQCNGCGVCLADSAASRMCPVFRGLGDELASSRAKVNLIAAWMAGEPSGVTFDARQLKDHLSLCMNCKMCAIDCPAGVDVSRLVIEARRQLARRSGFTAAEWALSHNRRLSVLAAAFAPLSNAVLSLGLTRWLMEKGIGLDRHRHFPSFQRGSFIRKARRYLAKAEPLRSPHDTVVYFVDSFANYNDHDLGFAVINVLRATGVEVIVPKQRPAPLPAYVYGSLKTARRDIAYNIAQLAPYAQQGCKIICSEPSAALCLRDEMRLLNNSADARLISENTFELMDYLDCHLELSPELMEKSTGIDLHKTLGYHAPCHSKALDVAGASIRLLKRFGIPVTDINGGCCGLAGTAGMQKKNHHLAEAIGGRLSGRIAAAGAEVVVTECAACKMQIEHLTRKPAIHPIKLIAECLTR